MGVVFALVVSPWVAYSWTHFHAPFATDNRAVALALDPDAYVMDFHTTVMPMLRDDPVAWLRKLLVHSPIVALAAWQAAIQSVFLIPIALAALATLASSAARLRAGSGLTSLQSKPFVAFLAVALAPIAAYVVTGYQESRYFSTVVWVGELTALVLLLPALTPGRRQAVVAVICAGGVFKSVALARYVPQSPPLAAMRSQVSTADTDSLVTCLLAAGAQPVDGVLFTRMSGCSTAIASEPCPGGTPRRRRATGAP